MKAILPVLVVLVLSSSAFSDELKLADGTIKKGVTISRVEPDGVMVATDDGIEKIPFTSLSVEDQKRLGYDPQKAAAFHAAARAAARAPVPKATPFPTPKPGFSGQPGLEVLKVIGTVRRIVPDGILISPWFSEPFESTTSGGGRGTLEYESELLIVGAKGALVDGAQFKAIVFPAGRYQYSGKTVFRYAVSEELARKH